MTVGGPGGAESGSRQVIFDVLLLTLAALALRWPFTSTFLWAWDSVLYARAIEDFHLGTGVLGQRPHPPGYVLYVAAARGLAAILGDANAGLVAVSVVAGSLAAATAYLFARAVAGRTAGIFAGAAALVGPLLWHASEIAYPYAVLGALSGALGLALWWAHDRTVRAFIIASALLGLAAGARQDLLAYVGPLWLFVGMRQGPAGLGLGTMTLGLASLAWLVPSAAAADGLARYAALVAAQAVSASELDGGIRLARNVGVAALGLRWQLLWLWPIALLGAVALARRDRAAAAFVAAWALPAVLMLAMLHTGEPGYTLVLAVPSAVLVGVAADHVLRLPRRGVALAAGAAVAVLVAALGAMFLLGHGRFTAHAIERHDRILRTQIAFIRERYQPSETAIVARANYLHAVHYLPEYHAVYAPSRDEGGKTRQLIPALRARSLAVLFDDSHPRLRWLATRVRLPGDVDLYVLTLDRGVLTALADEDEELTED